MLYPPRLSHRAGFSLFLQKRTEVEMPWGWAGCPVTDTCAHLGRGAAPMQIRSCSSRFFSHFQFQLWKTPTNLKRWLLAKSCCWDRLFVVLLANTALLPPENTLMVQTRALKGVLNCNRIDSLNSSKSILTVTRSVCKQTDLQTGGKEGGKSREIKSNKYLLCGIYRGNSSSRKTHCK